MRRIGRDLVRTLRSGSWLTRPLLWTLLLAFLAVTALVVLRDVRRHTMGGDFGVFYAASRLLQQGRFDAVLSPSVLTAVAENHLGTHINGVYPWPYPPMALLWFYPLGFAPFTTAYAFAMAVGLALYVSAVLAITRDHRWCVPALAFPGVAITLNTGHSSFLTAGLLGWALVALPRRPALAGVLAGLLTFKPHLAVLVPIALVASRQWRALGAAAATTVALALTSVVAFGLDPWVGFIRVAPFIRKVMEVHTGQQGGYQSVFSALRLAGMSPALAYGCQLAFALVVVVVVGWSWSRGVRRDAAAPVLVLGTLLATPYLYDYDYMLLAIALAFTIRDAQLHGWRDWEKSAFVLVLLVCLVPRTTRGTTHVSLAPATLALLLWLAARRARAAVNVGAATGPITAADLRATAG